MSTLWKNLPAATALLAALVSSAPAHADEIRIDTLVALDLSEPEDGFDRLRIEYFVDGGKKQQVARNMRLGDKWEVLLKIAFDSEVTIQLYEKEKWPLKDKKLVSLTLRAGDIPEGTAKEREFTGGKARYWMSIGRGQYMAPQPPGDVKRPSSDPKWVDHGIYTTSDLASAAGAKLVETQVAKKFRVIPGLYGWLLQYLPAPAMESQNPPTGG
jgi:hypothetical protein